MGGEIECPGCGETFSGEHQRNVHIASKHPDAINFGENSVSMPTSSSDTQLNGGYTYIGNGDGVSTGKTVEGEVPSQVFVGITYNNEVFNISSPFHGLSEGELYADQWFQVFEKLEGVHTIVLTGGGPTLHEQFYDILDYAIAKFERVIVETEGVTETDFQRFDCEVAVRMEYSDQHRNNALRRMTHPQHFDHNIEQGLVMEKGAKACALCRGKVLDKESHFQNAHEQQVIQMAEGSGGDIQSFEDVKPFLDRLLYQPREEAFQRGIKKLKSIDNPTTLKSHVYNDNSVKNLALLAENLGADSVFVPTPGYPERGITPIRYTQLVERIKQVNTINYMKKQHHEVDWQYPHVYQLENWEQDGPNRMYITPLGDVTPSPYLPEEKLGSILEEDPATLYGKVENWEQRDDL